MTWTSTATRPEQDGLQYHIRCRQGDVARYLLLPGDPARVALIAARWAEAHEVAAEREHVTFTGRLREGGPISACSTGAGGGSTASALEELVAIGADTFIRVGTCAAIQSQIACGDVVIHTGAMRLDGTSPQYVRMEYPATAHHLVVLALVQAAERLGARYHLGVSASTASFYTGQGRPGWRGYTQRWIEDLVPDLQRSGVLNFEMEAATIFTMLGLYGLRGGSVCAVLANRVSDTFVKAGVETVIDVANEGVRILQTWDAEAASSGKPTWYPELSGSKQRG
ncbi:MAG TPA: nucleoside phosphorylase [Chloroflexota bacterium]|nr:nucleoside phosphorylase [Chloroflexota bacterium]